ncbi:MAG: hypothetical protein KKA42_06485, partial [candidate division Zixibacteria bacterium]|nr:hypothetical protein [candidate division Zixibacteria bacterium]
MTDFPYTKYDQLLVELDEFQIDHFEGVSATRKRLTEAVKDLGLSIDPHTEHAKFDLLWRVCLVYEIVILESMIQDYAVFLASGATIPDLAELVAHTEDPEPQLLDTRPYDKGVKMSYWLRQADGLI